MLILPIRQHKRELSHRERFARREEGGRKEGRGRGEGGSGALQNFWDLKAKIFQREEEERETATRFLNSINLDFSKNSVPHEKLVRSTLQSLPAPHYHSFEVRINHFSLTTWRCCEKSLKTGAKNMRQRGDKRTIAMRYYATKKLGFLCSYVWCPIAWCSLFIIEGLLV